MPKPQLPEEPMKAFAAFRHNHKDEVVLPFDADDKHVWYWINDIPSVMKRGEFDKNYSLVKE